VTTATTPEISSPSASGIQPYTLRQRIGLQLITWAAWVAIRLIAPTLRFSVSWEDGAPGGLEKRPLIYSFWHRCVFPATYLWRNLNIRVMTSQSFDGEYIARIIEKFGFVPIRGSSTRGGVRALLAMRRETEQGWTVAFTIDGPRGPMYVAKPGPVLLARATAVPMSAFHIAVDQAWVLKTWDHFMIPKPFSRALMRVARNISVPGSANDSDMQQLHSELQHALDRVREFAEVNVAKVGTSEFPVFQRQFRRGP
jgi:lysophospholipid acyltransferase (LPLAT)-like uncharacterized protein